MLYSLNGILQYKDQKIAVIDCGGVGFRCLCTLNTIAGLPATGQKVLLYTFLDVKEDALDLYGFSTLQELECFKLLTSVSGVGPKFGLSMLSSYTPDRIALCIASGDTKTLTTCPHIGPKIASRIVNELGDKVQKLGLDGAGGAELSAVGQAAAASTGAMGDAIDALLALGYTQSEAAVALAKLDPQADVEELIKGALKALAGR